MNNKLKQTLLGTLSVAVLSLSATAASAESVNQGAIPHAQLVQADSSSSHQQEELAPQFDAVTGVIQDISAYGTEQDMQIITVESADRGTNRFVLTEDSYLVDEFVVGDEIIAFYDASLPVIMIYPPQYSALAVALVKEGRTVKVDFFDEELVSSDGSLKLHLSDETEIVLEDGTAYEGELANHRLIVSYGPSTRSIPAQATPEQIVVLADKEASESDEEGIIDDMLQPSYAKVTGTIQEISAHGLHGERQLISIATEDESPIHLIVSDHTYLDDELKAGDEIIAFYNENAPMILIYPPQYNVEAIALAKKESTILVDRFDENLLNSKKSLVLRIADSTQILAQDGSPFEGELANRKLFVEYHIILESYPAQTTPTRIIVLDEEELAAEPDEELLENAAEKPIVVNGKVVEAPSAWVNEEGVMMVPLRAIAEALDYEVTWQGETREVRIGIAISLQIDKDSYIFARMAPMELGTAPVLIDGSTFVPLSFFTEVMHVSDSSITKDGIVIQADVSESMN